MLSDFEIAVLQIVTESNNGYNWHAIAIRLSNKDVSQRPPMMQILRHLTDEGFLSFDTEKNFWHITDKGKDELGKEEI